MNTWLRKSVVAIMLCIVTPPVVRGAESDQRQRAEAQVKLTSQRMSRDKDLAAAKEGFLKAKEIDATYAMPLFYLGAIAQKEEKWSEATGYFEEFSKLDNKSDYYIQAQLRLDDLKKLAAADATPEGKLSRKYETELTKARELMVQGKLDDARDACEKAANLDPKRWEAYAVWAGAYGKTQDYAEAAAALKKAIELAPKDKQGPLKAALKKAEDGQVAIGLTAEATNAVRKADNKEAASKFAEAFKLLPEREDWGLAAALSLALANEPDAAADLLKKLTDSRDSKIATQARYRLEDLTRLKQNSTPAEPPELAKARSKALFLSGGLAKMMKSPSFAMSDAEHKIFVENINDPKTALMNSELDTVKHFLFAYSGGNEEEKKRTSLLDDAKQKRRDGNFAEAEKIYRKATEEYRKAIDAQASFLSESIKTHAKAVAFYEERSKEPLKGVFANDPEHIAQREEDRKEDIKLAKDHREAELLAREASKMLTDLISKSDELTSQ